MHNQFVQRNVKTLLHDVYLHHRYLFIIVICFFPPAFFVIPSLMANTLIKNNLNSIGDVIPFVFLALISVLVNAVFHNLTALIFVRSPLFSLPMSKIYWFFLHVLHQAKIHCIELAMLAMCMVWVVANTSHSFVAILLPLYSALMLLLSIYLSHKNFSVFTQILFFSSVALLVFSHQWPMLFFFVLYITLMEMFLPIKLLVIRTKSIIAMIASQANFVFCVVLFVAFIAAECVYQSLVLESAAFFLIALLNNSVKRIVEFYHLYEMPLRVFPNGLPLLKRACLLIGCVIFAMLIIIPLSVFYSQNAPLLFLYLSSGSILLGLLFSIKNKQYLILSQGIIYIAYAFIRF